MDIENEAPSNKLKRMKPKVVKEWSEDDIFKLISLVEQNCFFFRNAADEPYHNKVIREIAWQSTEDHFSGKFRMGHVQAKWTNLIIQFRGYAARAKTKSGQGAADTPKWKAMPFVGRAEDQQTQPTTFNLSFDENSESNSIDNSSSTPTIPLPASGTTKKRPHLADFSLPAAHIADTMREAVATLRARNDNSSGPNVTFTNYILKDILQILENNGSGTFDTLAMTETQSVGSPLSVSSSASSSPTFASNAMQSPRSNFIEEEPYIRILEQPHSKGLRFRYICEGRSAGSLPGINSTPENKTYPTIEIVGYTGNVKIIVSCVTVDEPYRPHPHNLVGKEGCEYGVCTMRLKGAPMRAVFSNLGIQCVKKKDIRAALEERERINIDPFKTKFTHKDQPSTIDLNVVRLCFQAFIPTGPRKYHKLKPVVSEPIYDKKSINDLVICRLCSCSAKVTGGDSIILLCEKLPKDDIKIRFYEEKDNKIIWEDFGEFQPTDIHKQTAITFKTPRYHNTEIAKKAQVYIQLVRLSNEPGATHQSMSQASDPLPFEFYPEPGTRSFTLLQRKLNRRQDMEIFQQILSLDSETTATKYSEITLSDEGDNDNDDDHDDDEDEVDDNDDKNESTSATSSKSEPESAETLNENDENRQRFSDSFDEDNFLFTGHKRTSMDIEFLVPQLGNPFIDDCTQTSTPMEDILRNTELVAVRKLTTVDKINEWMTTNEFERTDSLIVERGDSISLTQDSVTLKGSIDEDLMNTDLIEQDIELEDQCDMEIRTSCQERQRYSGHFEPISEIPLSIDYFTSARVTQEPTETKDYLFNSATNRNLQIAFENPDDIPHLSDRTPEKESIDKRHSLTLKPLSPAPTIQVIAAQPPQTPPSPPLPLPPRTPSPIPEQMLPPLPPKRKPSQELEVSITESILYFPRSETNSPSNTSSEIIAVSPVELCATQKSIPSPLTSKAVMELTIIDSPDQSPTKRAPSLTPSPKKKQGFFSRIFSRRKSRPEDIKSNMASPNRSRDPSLTNESLHSSNRASIRSLKSHQPNIKEVNSVFGNLIETPVKPVARSVSSVSGKRPARRDRDVIHIPLKGGPCYEPCCNDSMLDRKTLSASQLANLPAEDSDQFKRKRLRSGGNPMRIIQELQQIEQMQNSNNNCSTMWNIPLSVISPAMPEIKNEPFLSPNYYGAYRSPYQMSPSPQPPSPMNRNSTTPSPGLKTTSSAESQTQMCNDFNQIQTNFKCDSSCEHPNGNTNSSMPFMESRKVYAQNYVQLQATMGTSPSNPFFNPTSGGSITPLYPNENNVNVSNTSHFHAFSNTMQIPHSGAENGPSAHNILDNQFSYQYQQYQNNQIQQPEDTTEAAVTLNALLQIDSDNFVNINSEELRLSNLSIST